MSDIDTMVQARRAQHLAGLLERVVRVFAEFGGQLEAAEADVPRRRMLIERFTEVGADMAPQLQATIDALRTGRLVADGEE